MIDINLIRENKELVKENIRKKFQDKKLVLVDEVEDLSSRADLMTKYNLENTDSLIVVKTENKEKCSLCRHSLFSRKLNYSNA